MKGNLDEQQPKQTSCLSTTFIKKISMQSLKRLFKKAVYIDLSLFKCGKNLE